MTGPEHYRKAEEALAILDEEREPEEWLEAIRTGELALAMQAAQVHATLAVAATVSDLITQAALSGGGRS
jgi:hypothetical protein